MNSTISRFIGGLWIATLLGTFTASAQETGTVTRNDVNVRGRAGFIGEVVTRLRSGETVEVLERVTLSKTKSGEPADWLKIALPANTMVWVHGDFIDPVSNAVTASRLKVRGGAGVNYSVLGYLDKGTAVNEVSREGKWIEISPSPNLTAYIAASFVSLPAAATGVVGESSTPPAQAVVAEELVVESTVNDETGEETILVADEVTILSSDPTEPIEQKPVKHTLPGSTTTIVADPAPVILDSDPTLDRPLTSDERARLALEERTLDGQNWYVDGDPDDEVLKDLPEFRRNVTRQGFIRRTINLQSPSIFSLHSERNGMRINYLYTSSTKIPLKELLGVRVRITGEEGIDDRWPNTPVLLIKSLNVIP